MEPEFGPNPTKHPARFPVEDYLPDTMIWFTTLSVVRALPRSLLNMRNDAGS